MQLKSNLNHVFTSFSTKQPNNYRIFCGNKQIQSKYIYRFYDIIISPSHHPQPSQKHRHPCAPTNPPKTALSLAQHHILASLVKGRWIDGKAQTVALLLSACDMSTLFILQTFLPSRQRDCLPLHRILSFPQSSQKYNHPLLRTTFFHPLSKVRCCPTNSTIGSL